MYAVMLDGPMVHECGTRKWFYQPKNYILYIKLDDIISALTNGLKCISVVHYTGDVVDHY